MKPRYPTITMDHIWSAIRGLGMMQMPHEALDKLHDAHIKTEAFASRVIILAVQQVRALRATLRGPA